MFCLITGDYIAFLDSDDYIEVDYYRQMISKLMKAEADVVVGNTVRCENEKKYVFNMFKIMKKELIGENIEEEYFKQEGKNYSWHTIWNNDS